MKSLLPHVRLFRVLSVINLFLWTTTQHVIEHSLFRLSRQRGYSTSRMASVLQIKTPLQMCGMLWGGKLLVETILRQKQEHPHPGTHRGIG
ncbi:hypothetical protein TNCV_314991 [Trichonephila clavipes]|nr:hypothetical protein TNCV_314991 [Trichonephila clavipes]